MPLLKKGNSFFTHIGPVLYGMAKLSGDPSEYQPQTTLLDALCGEYSLVGPCAIYRPTVVYMTNY